MAPDINYRDDDVALILSDAPDIFVWISIGIIAWVAWIVIGPRLWRRYIEPGLGS